MASNGYHWKFNLYKAMKDPKLVVYEDDVVVIILDKYPKSELHFLVLPKTEIPNVASLHTYHISLLQHMDTVTKHYVQQYRGRRFWWGFHAEPTMVQLHLHVISDDFRGSGLKTAKHWNSYTTSFFVPLSKVIGDLQVHGKVKLPPPSICKALLKAPLACHKCPHRPANMPALVSHLLTHQ